MNIRATILLLIGLLSATCVGCCSIGAHAHPDERLGLYPGVRADADIVKRHPGEIVILPWFVYPFVVVDLPLSAVLDTVLLPIDLARDSHFDKRDAVPMTPPNSPNSSQ